MVQITFSIDRGADAPPLYAQLADGIVRAVEAGHYRPGDRLPTESELQIETGLSRGTIKEAYNSLERRGVVRKVRGSGVYVQEPEPGEADTPGRAVDALFERLTCTHRLAVTDAFHLFRSELDARYADENLLEVTVVDCNPETIHVIERQLETVPGMALSWVLHDELLLGGTAAIAPQCDLVLTTQLHYPGVCRYTEPLNLPTEPFALRESKETLAALSKLPEDQSVCVVYRSDAFLSSVRYTLRLSKRRTRIIPCREDDEEQLDRYCLSGLPFLLPPDYMTHTSSRTLQSVYRARSGGSPVIPMAFEIDQGSILRIAGIVKAMRLERERRRRYL